MRDTQKFSYGPTPAPKCSFCLFMLKILEAYSIGTSIEVTEGKEAV